MFINLHRTVDKIGQNLLRDGRIDFGSAPKRIVGEVSASQTDSVVCLTIPEPLPGLKELTGTVEDHWSRMIHEAIARQSKTHNSKSCDSYFLTKSNAG